MEFRSRPRFLGLYEWMQSIVMTFLVVLFLLTFVGQTMGVQQQSMSPTLHEGDRMIVRSILYTPRRGDVVIFAKQNFENGAPLVKRVIALAGDLVYIDARTGTVYVNHIALDEPYVSGPTYLLGTQTYPHTVPEGHVFVIGDNRNASKDSRHLEIGPVDTREILGQVVAIILPLGRAEILS